MKNLSDLQIRLAIIREWLLIALLAGAPFSFNPSVSTPAFGFVSFRLGLYQLLIVAFVAVMLPVFWQQKKKLIKDPLVLILVIILGLLATTSPLRSLHPFRSLLLSSSVLLLLVLLLSGWVYAKTLMTKALQRSIFRATVVVGLTVAAFSLLQFIYNSLYPNVLGLCANCGAHVFGFPRINGFAAEPQFYANSLIPPILLVYGYLMQQKKGKRAFIIFGVLVFCLTLTLSRGAYVAIAAAFVGLNLILLAYKKLRWAQVGKAGLIALSAGFLAITTMTTAATLKYRTSPDIAPATASTIVEHVSGGVIDLPFNNPKSVTQSETKVSSEFQSPGAIEASHKDRESAATMGLRWWRRDYVTIATGLGFGNLGSYAHAQDASTPLSFTIYMQYIFMLVEVGIIGLMSFMLLSLLAIVRATRLVKHANTTFSLVLVGILIGFMVHYAFFGTYINVPYIWLYTGIGLGMIVKTPAKLKTKRSIKS